MALNDTTDTVSYDHHAGKVIPFECYQGDLTIDDSGLIGHKLLKEPSKSWAAPVEDGDFVKLRTALENTIEASVANDDELVGIAVGEQNIGKGRKTIPDRDDGNGPFSGLITIQNVEIFGDFMREITYNGATPVVGNSVIHGDAVNTVKDKTSTTNTNLCVGRNTTASTANIIFGYHGKWDI